MESMTGYAYQEQNTEQFSYSVELKTLNNRYLETYINIPKILRNDENEFLNMLKRSFNRGKIELSIDIFDWIAVRPISLNSQLIDKYYKELKTIHDSLKVDEPLRFESILNLEGITQRERTVISDRSKNDIYKTTARLIKKTIEMRKKEGASIRKDLTNTVRAISERVKIINGLSKNHIKHKIELLKERINSISGIDDTRIFSEIAILADKLDINEEIIRLNDHIVKFKSVMKEQDQTGKRLDFLAQEMFREINTIGSKSNSSEISHIVVEIKNQIEQIREHCRNVV